MEKKSFFAWHQAKLWGGVFLGLTALLLWALLRKEGTTLRHTNYSLNFVSATRNEEDPVFFRYGWDGPTGSFSHANGFGVHLGGFKVQFVILEDPIAATLKRLPSSIPGLIQAVQSKDYWLSWCAAEDLGEKGAAALSALPFLLAMEGKSVNPPHFTAIRNISLKSGRLAVPYLSQALPTATQETAVELLEILGEMGPDAMAAKTVLLPLLISPSKDKAVATALALWKITGEFEPGLPMVLTQLRSRDFSSRASACYVLEQYGSCGVSAAEEVRRILQNETNYMASTCALRALGAIGPPSPASLPFLLHYLKSKLPRQAEGFMDEPSSIRFLILKTLGSFGRPAVPTLLQSYASTNALEKSAATRGLLHLVAGSSRRITFVSEGAGKRPQW